MKLGWLARHKNGDLCLYFNSEPFLMNNGFYWNNEDGNYMDLDYSLFPEVTFENSPQKVEINLNLI